MRFIMLTLIMTLLLGVVQAQDYKFISAKSRKEVPTRKLVNQLLKYDVIFFGEYHSEAAIHAAQRDLLPLLYEQNQRLILSFEMFERDVQQTLDDYLQGKINEDEFLAASRPWSNYDSDYRPLVEFAKAKGLTAIASNVPRRIAGKAARHGVGFTSELEDEPIIWMALDINTPEGKYKQRFMETMRQNAMHGAADIPEHNDKLFLAQCVKDDTMAESIVQYLERFPKHRIIHFNGDFHSREFLGTVERVLWRSPKLKVAVISPIHAGEAIPKNARGIATYLLQVPEQEQGGDQ